MTYTQAQIDKANAVDLEKFLRAQGETLVRSGKEYRWKAHDSLTVCGNCLLYTSPSPRDPKTSRMPSSA